MEYLLANWKLAAIAVLLATTVLLGKLWINEVRSGAAYRATVEQAGRDAKEEADKINAKHEQTVKDVSDAWNKQIQPARDGAVAAYKRRNPVGMRPGCGEVRLPGYATSAEVPDGAGQEPMAQPDAGFIRDCAEDALKIGMWQKFAIDNNLPAR